ncbi:MAG: nucleotide exchange factor GrpE [Acidaminococcales bacterium]|jgi:molecular chaperone GrpE|nr:nucleotide exchange factor GrpE [Acidaminococcales bacterium]
MDEENKSPETIAPAMEDIAPAAEDIAPAAEEDATTTLESAEKENVLELSPVSAEGNVAAEKDSGLARIEEKLCAIADGQQNILDNFADKLKYDAHKEKTIDLLHRELQEYKRGLLKNLLKPMALDLITLIDRNEKFLSLCKNTENLETEKLLNIITGYSDDLGDVLYRQGIEPFAEEGDFNPARQKILKVIDTDQAEKDKKIADIAGKGYVWEGQVLRQEIVNVYRYKNSNTESEATEVK